jgi:hypothetical protein
MTRALHILLELGPLHHMKAEQMIIKSLKDNSTQMSVPAWYGHVTEHCWIQNISKFYPEYEADINLRTYFFIHYTALN